MFRTEHSEQTTDMLNTSTDKAAQGPSDAVSTTEAPSSPARRGERKRQPKTEAAGTGAKKKLSVYEFSQHDIRYVPQEFRNIPLDLLHPSTMQPRRTFRQTQLKELARSMIATGRNMTALIVRPQPSGEGFEIICGERRWRAAQQTNGVISTLFCCVGDFTAAQALYMCGADNLQRENLNALEEAIAYENFIQSGMTHEEVAKDVGKSRAHISNYLRLLNLPLSVRDLLQQESLTFAHARPLCALDSPRLQIQLAKEAVEKRWSSKQVEDAVYKLKNKTKRPVKVSDDCNIEALCQQVSEQTGYPCAIVKTPKGHWQLGLSATTVEEFQGILKRLGVKTD